MKILVINGPNMNLLGTREPDLYGREDYNELCRRCLAAGEKAGTEIELFQSNHEGAIIDKIQDAMGNADGIVINAAGYSHTSVAILDALKAVGLPTVEVHVTDPKKREEFRHTDYVELYAEKTIAGKGLAGYEEAISYLMKKLS